jgi:hypothetical protein
MAALHPDCAARNVAIVASLDEPKLPDPAAREHHQHAVALQGGTESNAGSDGCRWPTYFRGSFCCRRLSGHLPHIIRQRVSCVVCRVSCVVCRVSCVVCRVSCVVCRVSCVVSSCVVCRELVCRELVCDVAESTRSGRVSTAPAEAVSRSIQGTCLTSASGSSVTCYHQSQSHPSPSSSSRELDQPDETRIEMPRAATLASCDSVDAVSLHCPPVRVTSSEPQETEYTCLVQVVCGAAVRRCVVYRDVG